MKSILKKEEAVEVEPKTVNPQQTNTEAPNFNAEQKDVKLSVEEKRIDSKPIIDGIEEEEIPF